MRPDFLVSIIIGLIFSIVPTIRIVVVWLQRNAQFDDFSQQFDGVNQRFTSIDRRFDEAIKFWREELRGFEERMVGRLKRLEAGRADGGHR
jgi:hypothetical protein